jgi:hypothetical protein
MRKKRACQLAFFSPIENITPFQRTIKALIFQGKYVNYNAPPLFCIPEWQANQVHLQEVDILNNAAIFCRTSSSSSGFA